MIDENIIKDFRKKMSEKLGVSEDKIGMSINKFNDLCSNIPEYDIGIMICDSFIKNCAILGKKGIDIPDGINFYRSMILGSICNIIKSCIPESEYEKILNLLKNRLLKKK